MAAMLSELLEQQAAQLQRLIDLQASEKELLVKRDAPALDLVTSEKAELIEAIQQTDQVIAEHPQKSVIMTHPDLRAKRTRIQDLLEQCQNNNEVNGQIVRLTLGRIQNLKQSLQAAQTGTTVTYTGQGKTSSGRSGKSIKA